MKKQYVNIYVSHLGKIMSNYSLLGVCLMLIILLATALSAFYYCLAFIIAFLAVIFTLGIVLYSNPEFIPSLFNAGDNMVAITTKACGAFPYLFGITFATSLVSLILLCTQKENKSVTRIVFSSIILALTVIFGLIFFLGGAGK